MHRVIAVEFHLLPNDPALNLRSQLRSSVNHTEAAEVQERRTRVWARLRIARSAVATCSDIVHPRGSENDFA